MYNYISAYCSSIVLFDLERFLLRTRMSTIPIIRTCVYANIWFGAYLMSNIWLWIVFFFIMLLAIDSTTLHIYTKVLFVTHCYCNLSLPIVSSINDSHSSFNSILSTKLQLFLHSSLIHYDLHTANAKNIEAQDEGWGKRNKTHLAIIKYSNTWENPLNIYLSLSPTRAHLFHPNPQQQKNTNYLHNLHKHCMMESF